MQIVVDHFLAKTNPEKTLMTHLWETAVMAEEQCRNGMLQNIVQIIADKTNSDTENVIAIISFIAGVHDIGKIHPLFQAKMHNQKVQIFAKYQPDNIYRHEVYGAKLVASWLAEKSIYSDGLIDTVENTVYMHHMGRKDAGYPGYRNDTDEKMILDIARYVLGVFWDHYRFADIVFGSRDRNGIRALLEGAIVISDWSASREGTYDNQLEDDFASLDMYLAHLRKQANAFIHENQMDKRINTNNVFVAKDPYSEIFSIKEPRPMQKDVISLLGKLDTSSPTLLLIEDACGGGKTEASELAALMLGKRKAGIYMAMPTSATAEAMQDRFQEFLDASGADVKAPLYTSKAWLSDADAEHDASNDYGKAAWTSEARTKLLYPSAIGTVDQIIQYAQMMRYGQIGLAAITGKTIIIDEIHDYDSYMLESIYALLEFCGWAGVSVVACSATLSDKTKRKLVDSYIHIGMSKKDKVIVNGVEYAYPEIYPISDAYPMVTSAQITKAGIPKIQETESAPYTKRAYKYNLISILGNKKREAKEIAEHALKKIESAGCVAVSMNTVDEARDVYDAVKSMAGNILVLLYLARTTPELLDETAKKILYLFGEKGKADGKRPEKAIVVCTPILQQSMDVDFDYMLVELRPIDSLIQTIGRYRRHKDIGTIRENNFAAGCIEILCSPEAEEFKQENRIYKNSDDPEAVAKTFRCLAEKGSKEIRVPDDIRELVNAVYCTDVSLSKTCKATGLIGSPYGKKHEYRNFVEAEALPSHVDTRLTSYPSVNVMICSKEQADMITVSGGLLKRAEMIELVRTCSVGGVPSYLTDNFKNSKQMLDKSEIHGRLEDYEIYVADSSGIVSGSSKTMRIDKEKGLLIE